MVGSFWFLALMIVFSAALAVGGLLLVRRFVNHEALAGHHEVAGYMLSIIGTLYAVVLGLIVVNALNTFQLARTNVEHEANALHDIFHKARGMPAPDSAEIRKACLDYARACVDSEWQSMEQGKPSMEAHHQVGRLWRSMVEFQPKTSAQSNLQQALIAEMDQFSDSRQTRLMGAQPSFDALIWGVLITGGVMLVVFTYFFGIEKLAVQIVMTVMVALTLSLNMSLVVMFGYPYVGDVKVSSQPFVFDLEAFQRELSEKN